METMQKAGCTVEEMIAGVERLAKVMKPIEETDIMLVKANPSLTWIQKKILVRKMRKAIKQRRAKLWH